LNKLEEAVGIFNGLMPNRTAQATQLSQVVKAGDAAVTFPLDVAGVFPGSFYQAMKTLAPGAPQVASDSILKLREETFLSDGVVALAKALLS
jgi:hypothetical protein